MTRGIDYTADFLKRAEKLHSMAAVVHDKEIHEKLLPFADDYEKLAEQYRCLTRREVETQRADRAVSPRPCVPFQRLCGPFCGPAR